MSQKLLAGWELTTQDIELPKGMSGRDYFSDEPMETLLEGKRYGKTFNLILFETFIVVEKEASPGIRSVVKIAPKKIKAFSAKDFVEGLKGIMPRQNQEIMDSTEQFLQPPTGLRKLYQDTYPTVSAVLILLGGAVVIYMMGVLVWAAFQG